MPTIDESLIHAYLDNELDESSRRRVEEAAQADPGVAREIAELALLRGLMANVHPPPDPLDVSEGVVAQIRRIEVRRRALQPIAASAVLAMAAMLMIALFWSRPVPPGGGQGAGVVVENPANPLEDAPLLAGTGQPEGLETVGRTPETVTPLPGLEPGDASPASVTDLEALLAGAETELSADEVESLAFVLDLIDHDDSREFVIEPLPGVSVADLAEEVDDLLHGTVRNDLRYGRLTPEEEEASDVFLLVANQEEQETLLRRIEEALGERCRVVLEPTAEGRPFAQTLLSDAEALTLGKVGQGARVFPLESPDPLYLANRSQGHEPETSLPMPVIAPSLPGGLPPLPRGEPSGALRKNGSRASEVVEEPGPRGGHSAVVMLWVRPAE